jgi:acetoin utilization protein AcuB
MLVKNFMTREVVTVLPETGVEEAYRLMERHNIRRLPVVEEDGTLIGIVTETDVRQVLVPWRSSIKRRKEKKFYYLARDEIVEDIMTSEVITIKPNNSITEVARLLHEHKFGGIPVVDDDGKVIGIVTSIDLIALLIDKMEDTGQPS